MLNLNDKVVLVTGAQQGIGEAIAIACGEAGARVVVNYLDDPQAAAAVAEAIDDGQDARRAVVVQGDVTSEAEVERMLAAADGFGGIDVLVNNAAVFPRVNFLDMSEADWRGVLEVNLTGVFRCTQAAARRMVAHGRGGSIINVSSVVAFCGALQGAHYVASKAGLVGFTRALALELAARRIRVNAIAPGLTDTAQPRYGMSEEEILEAGSRMPLAGINRPDDLAGLAVFLGSEAASRITGQTIHVNGGQFLY